MSRRILARVTGMLAASAAASAADVGLLLMLVRVSRLPIAAGAVLGSLVGGIVNFTLSRRFVFCHRGIWWRQWLKYLGLVVASGALLSGVLVHAGAVWMGLPLLAAKGAAALLVLAGWNYPISAWWIFGGKP